MCSEILDPLDEPPTFPARFLALPPELLTRILLFLSPDDLGVLSRCVAGLKGLEEDEYLKRIWFRKASTSFCERIISLIRLQTAPSRLAHALFSASHPRPDAEELVRRGTLRGVAIIHGVRNQGYWSSEAVSCHSPLSTILYTTTPLKSRSQAVRLSLIHSTLHLRTLKRQLSHLLSPSHRPLAANLHSRRILPSASMYQSPQISALVFVLEREQNKDQVRKALRNGRVGEKRFWDVMRDDAGLWREGERVRWAICPGINEKKRFWEELARLGH
ncbi:hypothetical protein P7C73_g3601, partial [Tremellales sp. Uapishka_1]